jgi:hypothetical protein
MGRLQLDIFKDRDGARYSISKPALSSQSVAHGPARLVETTLPSSKSIQGRCCHPPMHIALAPGPLPAMAGGFRREYSGRSPDWLKMKNPACAAVKREAEEDWGKERWR